MAVENERFWPSLYDRLRGGDVSGQDDYFIDASSLRGVVKRDLELLLNATALESCIDLEAYPAIRRSVLNYGLTDLTGKIVSGLNAWEVQESLQAALAAFEPRIVPDSVRVRVDAEGVAANEDAFDPEKGLTLSISGTILGTPMPEAVYIQTRWDAELSEAEVTVE